MYLYILALHIIFIVTWFAGMFYIVRLFIYNTEAEDEEISVREILHKQYRVMITRLWYGITWPSAVLTLIFGPWMFLLYVGNDQTPVWLWLKLAFVVGLYIYHFSLHVIYKQQMRGVFKHSSNRLRIWNELATLFLFAIVFLAVLKNSMNMFKGLIGLIVVTGLLMSAIYIYRRMRKQ